MPDAVSFRITTYRKLAKGETGLTSMGSVRLAASEVIDWVLDAIDEAAEGAITVTCDGPVTTTVIDWSKVPESVRAPKIPGRMVHLAGLRGGT